MRKKRHGISPADVSPAKPDSVAASASANAASAAAKDAGEDAPSAACLRLGWTLVAVFLGMGLVLESFHLVKLPYYLDVRLRRELWTLAHTHGTLLGAVNVLFGLSAVRRIAHVGKTDDGVEAAACLSRFRNKKEGGPRPAIPALPIVRLTARARKPSPRAVRSH